MSFRVCRALIKMVKHPLNMHPGYIIGLQKNASNARTAFQTLQKKNYSNRRSDQVSLLSAEKSKLKQLFTPKFYNRRLSSLINLNFCCNISRRKHETILSCINSSHCCWCCGGDFLGTFWAH